MNLPVSSISLCAALSALILTSGCQNSARTTYPVRTGEPQAIEPTGAPVLAEGALEEVELRSDEAFELALTIGGTVYVMQSARPAEENLEGARIEMPAVAGIQARVTCLNADCTASETKLLRDGRIATIRNETLRIQTQLGQVRDGCEVPLFFEEDYAVLFAGYPGFEAMIDEVRLLSDLTVSKVSVAGWTEESFENIELRARRVVMRVREESSAAALVATIGENGSLLDGAFVTLRRAIPGDPASLTDVTFELTQPGLGEIEGARKQICVDLRVLPPL